MVPEATSIVPPLAPRRMPRFPFRVKVEVVARVPPPKERSPVSTELGAVPRLASAPMLRTPALIVVAPVKVFVPERVSVPAPVLVSEPAPVAITPEMAVLPRPPTVRAVPEPLIPPVVIESVPLSELISVAPFRVTAPLIVLFPETFSMAPCRSSAEVDVARAAHADGVGQVGQAALELEVAPEETATEPVPRAVLFRALRTPPLTSRPAGVGVAPGQGEARPRSRNR